MTDLIPAAPSRSAESIEQLAEAIREVFALDDDPYFPVVEFLEWGLSQVTEGITFDVITPDGLGSRMGSVDTLQQVLYLREDVYERAIKGKARDRFTVAHEIGHAVMHVGTLNRVESGTAVPAYRNPEWQANKFAAALLMPRQLIHQCTSTGEIVTKFGVSREAAHYRAKDLGMHLS